MSITDILRIEFQRWQSESAINLWELYLRNKDIDKILYDINYRTKICYYTHNNVTSILYLRDLKCKFPPKIDDIAFDEFSDYVIYSWVDKCDECGDIGTCATDRHYTETCCLSCYDDLHGTYYKHELFMISSTDNYRNRWQDGFYLFRRNQPESKSYVDGVFIDSRIGNMLCALVRNTIYHQDNIIREGCYSEYMIINKIDESSECYMCKRRNNGICKDCNDFLKNRAFNKWGESIFLVYKMFYEDVAKIINKLWFTMKFVDM